jgi:hypothetical protein
VLKRGRGSTKNINQKNKVTIILTTTDLYTKLPTNKEYTLKEGHLQDLK